MRNKKGITLISLIITIIIMLILAGVSISMVVGEDGVLKRASRAKTAMEEAAEKEKEDIGSMSSMIDRLVGNNTSENNSGTGENEEEEWEKLHGQITSTNYGDYVDYKIDLGLDLTLLGDSDDTIPKTDWRIFCKDEQYVYLIAAANVPSASGLLDTGSDRISPCYEYTIYLDDSSTELEETYITGNDKIFGLNENSYVLKEGYYNSAQASILLNTTLWSKFVDTSVAKCAIGGPTIELFANSWNAKGYTNLSIGKVETGYTVNGYSEVNIQNTDNLYIPNTWMPRLEGFWLASPGSYDSYGPGSMLMRVVDVWDFIIGSPDNDPDYNGVRPVVCLKADVLGKLNDEGVWELK